MKHKHIIKSLPLLASVLGRKYGVEVRIGGNKACTNGNVIQLPSLPLNSDATLLGLARGYCDHESAHIRFTDFAELQRARLNPLEQYVWNTLEDWRVEKSLAAQYPGCRENFLWLIRHLFLEKEEETKPAESTVLEILDWLLLYVRAWDVSELAVECGRLERKVDQNFPGLSGKIIPLLNTAPGRCTDTQGCITLAREIVAVIREYVQSAEKQHRKNAEGADSSAASASQNTAQEPQNNCTPNNTKSLKRLLSISQEGLPEGIGERIGQSLQQAGAQSGQEMRVAVVSVRQQTLLPPHDHSEAYRVTTALRTRLQALLQSSRMTYGAAGHTGRFNAQWLHRLAISNPKVFLRREARTGLNTSVHVLLDASGSMNGHAMPLANQACFAVASALEPIKGISLAVTAFPGEQAKVSSEGPSHWQTVSPILKHNERLHARFQIRASGSTPLAPALWWTLQQMLFQPEPRKIILIITDGEPDNKSDAISVLQTTRHLGVEVYGVGIGKVAISTLLPQGNYAIINSINELPQAVFGMLQKALLKQSPQTP
ncbi:VWA domain-containing protein [Desulfovibrio sp. OttesenSCG-928-G15]|nr:VWA domain-containing protein [Desulfovibrio sp. OttesenSCG-928-G15]